MKISVLLLLSMIFLNCNNENPINIQPIDGNCFGIIIDKSGKSFAGAHVSLIPDNYTPLTSDASLIDSTITDPYGRYFFNVKKTGTYNLFAFGNNRVSMHSSVLVSTSSKINLKSETLSEPGALSGTIHLQSMNNHKSAVILFIGTNRFTAPIDSTGFYSASNLAPGSYHLKYFSPVPGFSHVDTTIIIHSQKTTQLPLIELCKDTKFSVESFSAKIDTALKIADLSWKVPFDTISISHFNLYANREYNPAPIAVIKNNVVNYQCDLLEINADTINLSLSIVDTAGSEGPEVRLDPIKKETSFKLVKTIQLEYSVDLKDLTTPNILIDNESNFYTNNLTEIGKFDSNGLKIASFKLSDSVKGYFQYDLQINDSNVYTVLERGKEFKLLQLDRNLNLKKEFPIEFSYPFVPGGITFLLFKNGSSIILSGCQIGAHHLTGMIFFDRNLDKIKQEVIQDSPSIPIINPRSYGDGILAISGRYITFFDTLLNPSYPFGQGSLDFLLKYASSSVYSSVEQFRISVYNYSNIFVYPHTITCISKQSKTGTCFSFIFFNDQQKVLARFTLNENYSFKLLSDHGFFYIFRSNEVNNARSLVVDKYYSEALH